jgi:hypothetical protein
MKINELNCEYNLILTQKSIVKTNSLPMDQGVIKTMGNQVMASAVGDSVVMSGKLTDSVFKLKNINLSSFLDGLIELKVVILDSLGNETVPVKTTIYKDTKDPILTFKKSSTTDLKAIYTLESNEYLSNSLVKDNLSINVGSIDSVKKISNILYNVYITRICNDTLNLSVKANVLLDTVGNKNAATTSSNIEKLIPDAPVVAGVAYCQGATAGSLTANSLTGHTLSWYNSSASGTPPLSSTPTPVTNTIGKTDYYVSQIKTSTGCESSKSKITVSVNGIPSAPILSRDTANYLVSTATIGNTWYKDGVAITDTNFKYKPSSPGAYTVKTTQNGCTSVASLAYYFLVTDVVNLSANEYIKLVPNPFVSHLNFDFVIKGYQKMNLDIFEITSGIKMASRVGLTAGSSIYFNELSAGTYIARVTSADGKISYQFKMVKL